MAPALAPAAPPAPPAPPAEAAAGAAAASVRKEEGGRRAPPWCMVTVEWAFLLVGIPLTTVTAMVTVVWTPLRD
jgi:hypothetical protein